MGGAAPSSTNARPAAPTSTNARLLRDAKLIRRPIDGRISLTPDRPTSNQIRRLVHAADKKVLAKADALAIARKAHTDAMADRRILIARLVIDEGIPVTALARELGQSPQSIHELILASGLREQSRTRKKRGQVKKSTQKHRAQRRAAAETARRRLEELGQL